GLEATAADLLLPLEEELHVERQGATRREERFRDRDGDEHRPLVVGDAAPVEATVTLLRRERLALPALDRIGRLHVVVAVHQERGRGCRAQPLAVDDRVAIARE